MQILDPLRPRAIQLADHDGATPAEMHDARLHVIGTEIDEAADRALLADEEPTVWLVVGDVEVSTSVEQVVPGDQVVVHAGKRIPVDGRVEEGTGTLNEAPITGESMPAIRGVGDQVYAGTVLMAGRLRIRVEQVGAQTAVGRLINRVEQAQESRAPIQTIGDRFSRRFVPSATALSTPSRHRTDPARRVSEGFRTLNPWSHSPVLYH